MGSALLPRQVFKSPVMSMYGHDVFSKVTGGRSVFTSEAVGGGAAGPQKLSGGGNRVVVRLWLPWVEIYSIQQL